MIRARPRPLLAGCAFTPAPLARGAVGARRAATPVAGLFDDLARSSITTPNTSRRRWRPTDSRTAAASHILFGFNKYDLSSAEGEAAALKAKIAAGEISFADAAAEYWTCPSKAKGGDLGTFKRGAMVPEFDAVCFDVDAAQRARGAREDAVWLPFDPGARALGVRRAMRRRHPFHDNF